MLCSSMACLSYLLPSSRFPSLLPKLLSPILLPLPLPLPLPLQSNSLVPRRWTGSKFIRVTQSNRSSVKAFAILQAGDESEEEEEEGEIKDYKGEEQVGPSSSPERWDVLGLGQAMVFITPALVEMN